MICNRKTLLTAACLLVAAASTFAQQEGFETVRGTVRGTDGEPVEGVRIVFEPLQGAHTFLSQPTGADGGYVVSLPQGSDFMVVAVISSTGQRSEMAGQQPFKAVAGVRKDLEVDVAAQLQTVYVTLSGVLTGPDGEPLEGFRLVLRQIGANDAAVSKPSADDGSYTAKIKDITAYQPAAVVAPSGRRIDLEPGERIQSSGDVTLDVVVPNPRGTRPMHEPAFAGADRLYQNFIEDVAIVEHWRMEFVYENTGAGSSDANTLRAIGAKQFKALPQLELGARIGIADADVPSLVDGGSGFTDLDLWAKLQLGPQRDGAVWAPGVKITVPTGKNTPGLGADSLGVKLFAAARQRVPHGVIAYNAAVEVVQDGQIGDVPLDGKVAPSAGIAYIWAPEDEFTIVGEMFFGFERFEDAKTDIRLSAGVNWKVPNLFTVRASLLFGLTDGAPDHQLIAGVSFDY